MGLDHPRHRFRQRRAIALPVALHGGAWQGLKDVARRRGEMPRVQRRLVAQPIPTRATSGERAKVVGQAKPGLADSGQNVIEQFADIDVQLPARSAL